MTLSEFMKLVGQMREAQKAYFKNRGFDNQATAMKLEREVDKVMAEHEGGQGKLFAEPAKPRPTDAFQFNRTTCLNCCEITVDATPHRLELLVDGDQLTDPQVEFMKEVAVVLNRHFPLGKIPE